MTTSITPRRARAAVASSRASVAPRTGGRTITAVTMPGSVTSMP
ncbi:MAG TPA: hypothetical protein VGD37_29430 [Kofleriaceae bacterium]